MSWKLVSRIQPTKSTRLKIETAFCHNESNRPLDAQGHARAEPAGGIVAGRANWARPAHRRSRGAAALINADSACQRAQIKRSIRRVQ